jgi:hypothetical protein
MTKKLDVEKVDSALKRAARVAISGARDERAGRLLARDASSGRFAEKTTPAAKDAPRSKSK